MPNANRTIYPALVVQWNGAIITDDYMNISWSSTTNMINKAAGTESEDSFIPGRVDNTVTISFRPVGTAAASGGGTVERIFYASNSGTIEWAPFGTAAGQPKYMRDVAVSDVTHPFEAYAENVLEATLKPTTASWTDNYAVSGDVYP
jgi:hypothetical protein